MEPWRKHHAKTRGWLGAGCALALLCAWASPRPAVGQTPTTHSSGGTKTDGSSTTKKANSASATPKKYVGGKNSGAGSSSTAGSHPASHSASHPASHPTSHSAANAHSRPSTGAHSKANTAVAGHSSKSKYASTRKSGKKKTTARGQQKIDPERAEAIQEALIREHYMSGEAAGKWDQASEDAMRRYQADHGWQSKTVPDSRALISLGLGPSHNHLLNPESAMTTEPAAPRAESLSPVSHSADPGARVNETPAVAPAPAAPAAHDSSSPQ